MTLAMTLTRPCAECPFRTDIHPYVTVARAREIASSLERGTFPCHKTLDYSEDEDGSCSGKNTDRTQHCAGAMIMLEHEERPSQLMRIFERLGAYDRRKLDMSAPVYESAAAFVAAHGGGSRRRAPREVRTCTVVNDGCLAPAGFLTGSGVARGTVSCRGTCWRCGDPVCSAPGCSRLRDVGRRRRARVCDRCESCEEGEN